MLMQFKFGHILV